MRLGAPGEGARPLRARARPGGHAQGRDADEPPVRAARPVARLQDRVAVVTGASRGAGKGIALALGEEGATVYVTGRSVRGGETTLGRPGTIDDTADEVTARGGIGIAVRCDHTDDAQVDVLFERVRRDHGRVDLLVNNAWSGYELSPDPALAFWEIEWRHWDLMFDGGLRAAAYAARSAAPMMVEAGSGLIVNVTVVFDAPHGHAVYIVMKTAMNVLTEQLAEDLRPHNVAVVGVAPGWMRLERMNLTSEQASQTESAEFPGRAIAALASDSDVLVRSGGIFRTPDLARDYGFTDIDGSQMSPWWREALGRE